MIYIIVPVHNRKEFTRNCIISLRNQTCKDFSIIIIDDGSTDGTKEMLESEFPEVVLLKADGNLWWTKAINIGIKYALGKNAEYILTLNNDTILFEDYIEKMIYWASAIKTALLGSLAFDFETKIPIYGGELINWKKASFVPLLDKLNPNDLTGLRRVSHYPGRGLLIPTKVFNKMGLFDEKHFPHYAADFDFTHRAERNGFEVYCNYDARLYMFPEESGDSRIRETKTIKNYFLHLFSIKGGGNLRTFIVYGIRNCPPKYIFSFLIIGISKRILGYLIDWFSQLFENLYKHNSNLI